MNEHRLTIHLQACVPIEIRSLQAQGGPTEWHIEEAQRRMSNYSESGEQFLLAQGFKRGETARAVGVLTECLAVLAFMPDGVRAFGNHWKAEMEEAQNDLGQLD